MFVASAPTRARTYAQRRARPATNSARAPQRWRCAATSGDVPPTDDDAGDTAVRRGAFFGRFLRGRPGQTRRRMDRVPEPETACACGSGRAYSRCCMPVHTGARPAADAEGLLRARYAAYVYRLPGYLMRTTSKNNPDYTDDWGLWEAEILEFCDSYKFLGLELIDVSYASPDVCFIQFLVRLARNSAPGFFIERSRLTVERGKWLYASGKLISYDVSFA